MYKRQVLHGLDGFHLHHDVGGAVDVLVRGQLDDAVAIVPQAGGAAAPVADRRILAVVLQAADVVHGADLGDQQGVRSDIRCV